VTRFYGSELLGAAIGNAAENFERKDFTPSAASAIKRALDCELWQDSRRNCRPNRWAR
jgi:hypothetical protein